MHSIVTRWATCVPPKIEITRELRPQYPGRNEFTGSWGTTRSIADAKPGLGSSRKEEFVLSPSRAGSSPIRACRRDALLEAGLSLLEQTAFAGEGLRGHGGVVHKGRRRRVQIGCCGIQARISLEQ